MFFRKKTKDPLRNYLDSELNNGLKKAINDGLINLDSPLAGMHISNYISHMKKAFEKTTSLLAIHYSLQSGEVSMKILEAIAEFKNKWIES